MLDTAGNRQTPSIYINSTDIAWESDVEYKFKNAYEDLPAGKTWQDVQWQDVEDGNIFIINFIRTLHCMDENCWSTKLQETMGKN